MSTLSRQSLKLADSSVRALYILLLCAGLVGCEKYGKAIPFESCSRPRVITPERTVRAGDLNIGQGGWIDMLVKREGFLYVDPYESVHSEKSNVSRIHIQRVKGGIIARCNEETTVYDGKLVSDSPIPVIGTE
jgi:hypothetical protein